MTPRLPKHIAKALLRACLRIAVEPQEAHTFLFYDHDVREVPDGYYATVKVELKRKPDIDPKAVWYLADTWTEERV